MEDIAARRAAQALFEEHRANVQFKPLGPPDGPATISDAYDIQERYVALLRGTFGNAVGYKVGLTSAPMQAFCGSIIPSRVSCSQNACTNLGQSSGVQISDDSAWNLKSPSVSSQMFRSPAGHGLLT